MVDLEKLYMKINNVDYDVKICLRNDEIVFNLKSTDPPKQFSNYFDKENLEKSNPNFRFENKIEDISESLKKYIRENNYISNITEEKNLEIIFAPYGTNMPNFFNIPALYFKLILKPYELDDSQIKYELLTDGTKSLIDNNNLILGIDLGTTYSTACILIEDKIIVIPNSLGSRNTPSYIMFLGPNERCVGELAKLFPFSDDKNIIFNSKRLLGQNYNDDCIRELREDAPFDIIQKNNKLKIKVEFNNDQFKEFYPEQISAMILKKIIEDSEYYLTEKIGKEIKINKAVITVPAYFNQKQREATKQAAEIINLEVVKMINEPTAASLVYAYESIDNKIKKYITVIDFGGGTLDITLLQFLKNEKGTYCDIKFTYGDTHFGGEDFDYAIMGKIIGSHNFDKKNSLNIRLKRACEKAKIELSYKDSALIKLEQFRFCKDIDYNLTRNNFENICSNLFDKFQKVLNDFLTQSGFIDKKNEIAEVILIGGSILIPKIKQIIKTTFNNSIIKEDLGTKEAVAKGAAIEAAIKSKLSRLNYINLLDVTNLSLGVNTKGDIMSKIIKRSTPVPIEESEFYCTAEKNQTEALIEIYEGEDKEVKNNLFLGKFIIKDLPKSGNQAKIKVQIKVDENSILDVQAIDQSNINHEVKLRIERPKGLRDIIEDLKSQERQMNNMDLSEYSKDIKNIVIDYNVKIFFNTNKNELNNLYKSLIEYLGKFLININGRTEERKNKIYLSYVAYYFDLIRKYIELLNNNLDKNFIDETKNNISQIMNQIQFYNSEAIFDLIECFVGCDELYSSCVYFLLNYFYGIIDGLFFENKQINNRVKALNGIDKIRSKVQLCAHILNKIRPPYSDEIKILKETIEDFPLALKIRDIVIEKCSDIPMLKDLIDRYKKSKKIDYDDLSFLEGINSQNIILLNKMLDDYDKNLTKTKDEEYNIIYFFIRQFPPFNSNFRIDELIKAAEESFRFHGDIKKYLTWLIGEYNREPSNEEADIIEIYKKIRIFLNHLKIKYN